MAETTQLLNQAKAGTLTLDDFMAGRTPNINQPQKANVPSGGLSLDAFMQSRQQQAPAAPAPVPAGQGLPVAETVPASAEVLAKPSMWRDFLAPSIKDAGRMAVESALPIAGGIVGGAAGAWLGPAGAIAGASAGGAAGTYLNEMFGIDDSTVVDYALNAGLPLAGGVAGKAGKAILKRLPSFQVAQKAAGVKVARELTDMVLEKPEKQVVKSAYEAIDNMGITIPTVDYQLDIVKNVSETTQKFISKQLATIDKKLADIVDDPLRVAMTPTELNKYQSALKTMRDDLLRRGKPGDVTKAAQIKKVSEEASKRIAFAAANGDPAALAIQKANGLYKQAQTYDDIDELLQGTIKSKVQGGQLVDEINVAKIWNRVNTIERQVSTSRHSKDPMTKAVRSLMDNPEAMTQFKDGLKRIAKLTPDGSLRLIGEHGGGILERAARMAGQEINTGTLSRLLGTPMGLEIMERTLREGGGKMTVPAMATMFATIRPMLTGVLPENDEKLQKLVGTIQESVNLTKQSQARDANASNQFTPQ